MQRLRIFLYLVALVLIFLLYNFEHQNQKSPNIEPVAVSDAVPKIAREYLHGDSSLGAQNKKIRIETDSILLQIGANDAEISSLRLKKYPSTDDRTKPMVLLSSETARPILMRSSLTSGGGNTNSLELRFQPKEIQKSQDGDKTVIPFVAKDKELSIEKIYTVKKGSYQVDLEYRISNTGAKRWKGGLDFLLLSPTPLPQKRGLKDIGPRSQQRIAISTPKSSFRSFTDKKILKNPLEIGNLRKGWIALVQHYFVYALIPDFPSARGESKIIQDYNLLQIGANEIEINPSETKIIKTKLYFGPKIPSLLAKSAPHLEHAISFSWFWSLARFIIFLLGAIHSVCRNWGLSIIILTILIKLALAPLTRKGTESMAKMKNLRPKINRLKELYGDDRQKMSQELMSVYRKEGVNPLGGCLPMIIQIPIFFTLYYVLFSSVELRYSSFLWIKDLTRYDPFFVLPLLIGGSMLLLQRLSPPVGDPVQEKVMMFLPLMMTIIFLHFPAGLGFYMVTNNTVSFIQQWLVQRRLRKREKIRR